MDYGEQGTPKQLNKKFAVAGVVLICLFLGIGLLYLLIWQGIGEDQPDAAQTPTPTVKPPSDSTIQPATPQERDESELCEGTKFVTRGIAGERKRLIGMDCSKNCESEIKNVAECLEFISMRNRYQDSLKRLSAGELKYLLSNKLKNLKYLELDESTQFDIEYDYTRWADFNEFSVLNNLKKLEYLSITPSYNPSPILSTTPSFGLLELSFLSDLTNLKELKLVDLNTSKISTVSNLTNLKSLSIKFVNPQAGRTIDLSSLEKMKNLESMVLGSKGGKLAFNNTASLGKLTKLKSLNLTITKFSDSADLSNLIGLHELYLAYTNVSDISGLGNLTKLEILHLSGTKVSEISPLKNLANLKQLSLGYTNISDISPLENLTKLESLDLANTKVSDISPLKNLTKLETLNLSNTNISGISSLKEMTNLKHLTLTGTNIPPEKCLELAMEHLTKTDIACPE